MEMNDMGMRGERQGKSKPTNEFKIFKNVEDIKSLAKQNGCICEGKVDVRKLATSLGLNIVEECFDQNVSGKLVITSDETKRSLIYVNENHSENRKRFTIAHEIAHYVLHRKDKTEFSDAIFFRRGDVDGMEYAANKFAADLLMPERNIRKLVISGIRDVSQLSEKFGVSAAAMKYRLEQLGYKLV